MKKYNIAIVGATGAVGDALLQILDEVQFPIKNLHLLASARSLGTTLLFQENEHAIQALEDFDFKQADIAFFSAGGSISEKYAPIAAQAGCIVIDNTSHFRLQPDIPLVVPEVNPEQIALYKNHHIIANPNCSTIQLVVALKPIYDKVGINRINVATYQSVSGTGKPAIAELLRQTQETVEGKPVYSEVYPIPIAFNLIPHIDVFEKNGYTKEEMKIVLETRKIMNDNHIQVNPTAVRVPVFYGHSEVVHIETKEKITASEARKLLENAPGIIVKDTQQDQGYPSPLVDAAGKNAVFVGRIREDISHPLGLDLWVVSDNIRKGAALNSVQIAQILIKNYLG